MVSATASGESVTIRSGNGLAGSSDSLIRYVQTASSCNQWFPAPFSSADFAAAATGPFAGITTGLWGHALQCDPQARWIVSEPSATPYSALYAAPFTIQTVGIVSATMSFCWSVDDLLGDDERYGTVVNPAGVYLNGTPILEIAGGDWMSEHSVANIDVTSLLKSGENMLYVYERDYGCVISGVIFSAAFEIVAGPTAVEATSWGAIKTLYR